MNILLSTEFWYTVIAVTTPILFSGLACLVFFKGGVDAIATEGIMLFAALMGVLGSYYSNSWFIGILAGMAAGAFLAIIYGVITIKLKSNDILGGVAINTFSVGFTVFLMYVLTKQKGSTQTLANPVVPDLKLPIIEKIPFLGEVLSMQNLLTYVGFVTVPLLIVFLYKSRMGLRIRTIGESEDAAVSVGLNISKYKLITLIIAGALAGLGGVYLSMGYVSAFSRNMVAGRGFIGMAAESMGRGTPVGVLISALVFGAADALAKNLQLFNFPSHLINLMPYLITIIATSVYSYIKKKQREKRLGA